jgi:hypothetical protein
LARLVCVYDWILVGGGDSRFEFLLDWIDPSPSLVVCPLASASSIPLVESSSPSPSCKLTCELFFTLYREELLYEHGKDEWTLVLKPFCELPKKQRRVRLEERITKFRFNFYTLLREQSRGLTKWRPYRDRPSSPLSPLATAPSNELSTNDTDTAANEITLADNNTMSSDPYSDDGDGKGGKDITASEQADKSFAGMFSTNLKEKATRSARDLKQTRLQQGRWREKSAEMTYEERQKYFKAKHQQVDEKALMSAQSEREAKMETKRKNKEWSENSKVIEGIFRKPAKLLQKEKK